VIWWKVLKVRWLHWKIGRNIKKADRMIARMKDLSAYLSSNKLEEMVAENTRWLKEAERLIAEIKRREEQSWR